MKKTTKKVINLIAYIAFLYGITKLGVFILSVSMISFIVLLMEYGDQEVIQKLPKMLFLIIAYLILALVGYFVYECTKEKSIFR